MTRGLRNNNPLNIRKGSNWKGLSKVQSDKKFCQFDDIVYGVRAALVVLRTYHYKHRLYSLIDVISRFAPSSDGNNVSNYCYLISKYFNISLPPSHPYHSVTPHSLLNLWWNNKEPKPMVFRLLSAMCVVESNYNLDYQTYLNAVALL